MYVYLDNERVLSCNFVGRSSNWQVWEVVPDALVMGFIYLMCIYVVEDGRGRHAFHT